MTDSPSNFFDTVARARRAQQAVNDLGAGRPTFPTPEDEAQLALLVHREQFIASQRDTALEVLRNILTAWSDAGPMPDFHAYMKSKLHREWPVLARALDEAAVLYRA